MSLILELPNLSKTNYSIMKMSKSNLHMTTIVTFPSTSGVELQMNWNADVFVSIHANAYGLGGWNDVQGIETYIHTSEPPQATKVGSLCPKPNVTRDRSPESRCEKCEFLMF